MLSTALALFIYWTQLMNETTPEPTKTFQQIATLTR